MKDITITFSASEIRELVRQAFIGAYVLESLEDDGVADGPDVLNKLLGSCEGTKAIGLVEKSEIDGKWLLPIEMEEELVSTIDEYDEDTFFEALLDELVSNEIERTCPPRILANLSEERFAEMSADLERKYVEEFQNNGYKNLTIPGLSGSAK